MPLTSPLLLVVLAAVAEPLLYLAVRRGGIESLWARLGSGSLAVVLLLAGGAAWTNDHYGLYRSWRDLLGVHSKDLVPVKGGETGLAAALTVLPPDSPRLKTGTLIEVNIPGSASGVAPRHSFVYLPPQYRDPLYTQAEFPVVEALQGSPGRPSDWILGMRLDQEMDRAINAGIVRPTIVVMPDTNGSLARSLECTNTRDGIKDETFLVSDVRAWMNSTFRVEPGRWVTMGYSTGGYCALDLTLRHPSVFASAISLDGYSHAIADGYARDLWRSKQDQLEHSPDWIVSHRPREPVNIYLLAGRDDRDSITEANRFWGLVNRYSWRRPHDALIAQPRGRHTFPAWEAALGPALEWALPGPSAPLSEVTVTSDTIPLPPGSAVPATACPTPSPVPSGSTTPTPRPGSRPTPTAAPSPRPSGTLTPRPTASARPAGR